MLKARNITIEKAWDDATALLSKRYAMDFRGAAKKYAALGWSSADLAEASGISRPTVARFEIGSAEARPDTVETLRRAFEAAGSWRVRDASGAEIAQGIFSTSVGTSAVWGTFTFRTQLPAVASGPVTLDVFQASAQDGSDVNNVEIPLQVQ